MSRLGDIARKLAELQVKADAAERTVQRRRAQPLVDRYDYQQDVRDLTWDTAHLIVDADDAFSRKHATEVALAGVREVVGVDGAPIPNGEPAPIELSPYEKAQRQQANDRYRAQQESLQLSADQKLQREWEAHRDEVNAARREFRRNMILEGVEPSKLPADLPKQRPREWGLRDGQVRTIPYVPPTDSITSVTDLGDGSKRVERTVELGATDALGRSYQPQNALKSPEMVFAEAAAKEKAA